ncbi:MAG TPA: PaaX family transcriptional regulator C-terminal domain-containing protein [Longimicrobiales bacterium]|nr:PaaX family transcriptional regulator C-terminal domain-containing protein [Longimicrobiales bacterium]
MKSKRPQDLVFTLFGEYLLHRRKPVWVGSLISLLRPFGLTEGAVRTVLSRMTRKSWLGTRRRGRNSFYSLTARGHRLLEEGRDRIFHPTWEDAWSGHWYLVTYSIPEDTRHLRDRLRVRLAWLGFGSMGNGVWITPHDVEDRILAMASEMNVQDKLFFFRAEQLGHSEADDLVRRSWDLDALSDRYGKFLERWRPVFDRYRGAADPAEIREVDCFVDRFKLIHEFRRFPLEDPFLPQVLLPPSWPGQEAATLFNDLHDLLEPPAERYVAGVLDDAPASTPARAR